MRLIGKRLIEIFETSLMIDDQMKKKRQKGRFGSC